MYNSLDQIGNPWMNFPGMNIPGMPPGMPGMQGMPGMPPGMPPAVQSQIPGRFPQQPPQGWQGMAGPANPMSFIPGRTPRSMNDQASMLAGNQAFGQPFNRFKKNMMNPRYKGFARIGPMPQGMQGGMNNPYMAQGMGQRQWAGGGSPGMSMGGMPGMGMDPQMLERLRMMMSVGGMSGAI